LNYNIDENLNGLPKLSGNELAVIKERIKEKEREKKE
jgi:hypothetical protein